MIFPNPIAKLWDSLGLTKIPEPQKYVGPIGSAGDTKVPFVKRVKARRRKNKQRTKSRRRNRT